GFCKRAYAAGRGGTSSLALNICTNCSVLIESLAKSALRSDERRCADEPIAAGALGAIKRCIGPLDPDVDARCLLVRLGGAKADGATQIRGILERQGVQLPPDTLGGNFRPAQVRLRKYDQEFVAAVAGDDV